MHLRDGMGASSSFAGPDSVETPNLHPSDLSTASKMQHQAGRQEAQVTCNPVDFELPIIQDVQNSIDIMLLAWVLVLYRYTGSAEGFFCQSNEMSRRLETCSFESVQFDSTDILDKVLGAIRSLRKRPDPRNSQTLDKPSLLLSDGNFTAERSRKSDCWASEVSVASSLRWLEAHRRQWSWQIEASVDKQNIQLSCKWQSPLTSGQANDRFLAFTNLLQALQSHKIRSISDALDLSERELNKIWQWNAEVPECIEKCIHELIVEQASRNPEKPAVCSWDGDWSYNELNRLSEILAQRLFKLGVRPGLHVPLCFEKSRWTPVAVLAVMKAGGAFALMDPSQPQARLKTIVEQTGASHVLVSQAQMELGHSIGGDAKVVVISADTLEDEQDVASSPLPPVPSTSKLYIQFTSGSTGKPKGVVISHETYTSGAIPRAAAVGYQATSRVLDFASYAFDVSIDCMLCTLANGGCICVPSDDARVNDLSGAIRSMNVNMAHMTPSVARILDPETMSSLEVLGLGGESVSALDASAWSKRTKLVVAYGPSECTVGCTINNNVTGEKLYTDIGKGVGGVTWIVDPNDHERLTPLGAVGELIIEGPVVGQGYLSDREMSEVLFFENPKWLLAGHSNVPGRRGRFYKTGDLVQYDPDGSGCIVFVGRKDQQVKLRGQRVELAEIEHHLRKMLPSDISVVAEVIKPGGGAGEPTLVAFLAERQSDVSESGGDIVPLSKGLRKRLPAVEDALAAELPIYMVPTAYIPLHRMPSLVSCKVDRKRLRQIGSGISRQQFVKLRVTSSGKQELTTDKERILHKLWTNLLGSDLEIGAQDSFFALGGDSLRAMRLVAAARSEGISLTVASIFMHPKLADMAAHCDHIVSDELVDVPAFSLLEEGWTAQDACAEVARLCGLDLEAVEDMYPCTPLQEALMALSAKVPEAYVAQRVVELEDADVARRLRAAFVEVAKNCPILRTRIVQVPGHGLMQVVVSGSMEWYMREDLQQYLLEDRKDVMGLTKPLCRLATITHQATGRIHMVWSIHHALYDGWSMPLIIDRINQAYQLVHINRPTPFNHFIKYLQTSDRSASGDYWRNQLSGASGRQFPALPYAGYQTRADTLLERYIPVESRSSNTTLATAIRGAWALVSSQYTGSNDVVFGETLTGRNAAVPGIEQAEGPLITTVPIRIQLQGSRKIAEFLQEIHDQSVERMPHEHFGLQHIRRLSADARDACELRTGLVLHPSIEEAEGKVPDQEPANGFVPVGDSEAAREALRFNTYALMLVCSLNPKGFLVMASFDSKSIDAAKMTAVLARFERVLQELYGDRCEGTGGSDFITDDEKVELWTLSGANESAIAGAPIKATATWIVNPEDPECLTPLGGVGELLFEAVDDNLASYVENLSWLRKGCSRYPGRAARLFRTGELAMYSNGRLMKKGKKGDKTESRSHQICHRSMEQTNKLAVSTEKQLKLAAIWSRTLGISRYDIGLDDSFFSLGGDSIGAMKLVSEARAENLRLSVADVFKHRTLYDMVNATKDCLPSAKVTEATRPFSALAIADMKGIVSAALRPLLADQEWKIVDVLPLRPLQEIAVKGTTHIPRYSARYEAFYLDSVVDRNQLFRSCQTLVQLNEILRTVFIELSGVYYGVVLEQLTVPIETYEVEGDLAEFTKNLCHVDIQTKMPLGSSFVKFLYVQGEDGTSSLILRISHAQYDEICLPRLLQQLSALHEDRTPPESLPFSKFVNHVMGSLSESVPYWRKLLKGSSLTALRPNTPVVDRNHAAITMKFDISARSRDVTAATLPTAAWALCLARRLNLVDVTFGEVVSGRNMDLPHLNLIMGPCWQYVPVRVKFEKGWTANELLNFVQHQHIASARYEGMALKEIVEQCTDWPRDTDWFDSVVHQDVDHVESLDFLGATSRMETFYPHAEPLREWKIQAFVTGDNLTIEIVTFESWRGEAHSILKELGECMLQVVERPNEVVLC